MDVGYDESKVIQQSLRFTINSGWRSVARFNFQPGDLVIYAMPKRSRQPGPRARSIHPAPMGDDYAYVVDKFWVVIELVGDDQVLLKTRRGKTRIVRLEDPLLRKARWWERWRYRNRFPAPAGQSDTCGSDEITDGQDSTVTVSSQSG